MADEWARDFTNDIDWDAFMNPDSWAEMPDVGCWAFEGGIAAPAPSSTAFGKLSGSQELPCESLVQEDLHSPKTYFKVGLENTRNLEISKSLSNAESAPRNQNSSISYPKAGVNHTVNDRYEIVWFPNPTKSCTCISCQELGVLGKTVINREVSGINGCKYTTRLSINTEHEREHFKTPGGYACAEQGCHFVNKKFTDLQRHYTSKNCTNPNAKNLECPETGCEYRTARKDKLKEHQKCKHKGKPKLGKTYRVIKPAISSKLVSGTSGLTATE